MKHKLFAIVISLALIVTMVLPGTLAMAAVQDSSTGEVAPTVETTGTEENAVKNTDSAPVIAPAECSCRTETEIHVEGCPLYVTPASDDTHQAECTCEAEDDIHTENCPLFVAPKADEPSCSCSPVDGIHEESCPLYIEESEPVCTCGTEDDVHTENCPLFVAPKADEPSCSCALVDGIHEESCPLYVKESEPVCTCGTQDGVHAESCPLYAEPQASVYEQLLAAETLDEFQAIIEAASEEELSSFTCEEFDNVDAHYIYLSTGEYPDYSPVVDEVMEIVNFTNVAPFVGTGE